MISAMAAGSCGGVAGEWSRAATFAFAERSLRSPFACDASAVKLQYWGGRVSSRRPSWAGPSLATFASFDAKPYPTDGNGMRP